MNWYMAKIVYRILTGDGTHKPQFDEQVRLVQAPDKKEAFDRARWLGRKHEFSFTNQKQQPVQWIFIDIAELHKLPDLNDGTEIYSRLSEADHAGTFIDIVHGNAEQIRSSIAELTTELI